MIRNGKKRWFALSLACLMTALMILPGIVHAESEHILADPGVVSDDLDFNSALGLATQFHIFSNIAQLNVHVNGNVATGLIRGDAAFGTNVRGGYLPLDLHYIQQIESMSSSAFVRGTATRENKVVFGQDVLISKMDNGNKLGVNGIQINHIGFTEAFQDRNGSVYIDFADVFAQLSIESDEMAEQLETAGVVRDFRDQNNRKIDISNVDWDELAAFATINLLKTDEQNETLANAVFDLYSGDAKAPTADDELIMTGLTTDSDGLITVSLPEGQYYFKETAAPSGFVKSDELIGFELSDLSPSYIYVDIDASVLELDRPLKIDGLSSNGPSVIFNVRTTDDKINIRSKIVPIIEGKERHNQESENFSDAVLLWNFPTSVDEVLVNAPFSGTILATSARVEANHNVDGSIIADYAHVRGGESHRWDFNTSSSSDVIKLTAVNTADTTEPTEPTEPEVTEAEVTEPEVTEPEVTEPTPEPTPEVTEPTEPEVTEPEVTDPGVTEPQPTEPEITEPTPDPTPEVTEPEVTEPTPEPTPEVTEPQPTEPEITEPTPGPTPEVTEPTEPTEPEITEPEVTEPTPEVTEPEGIDPEVTEPDNTTEDEYGVGGASTENTSPGASDEDITSPPLTGDLIPQSVIRVLLLLASVFVIGGVLSFIHEKRINKRNQD